MRLELEVTCKICSINTTLKVCALKTVSVSVFQSTIIDPTLPTLLTCGRRTLTRVNYSLHPLYPATPAVQSVD